LSDAQSGGGDRNIEKENGFLNPAFFLRRPNP
jgi:hypothetical protein